MSDLDAILASLPIDSLANKLGEDSDAVRQAAQVAIPALLGGMQANAQGGGAASLLEAVNQHAGRSVDPNNIDVADGAKIASHIFGDNQDQVVNQLGASGGASSGLINKLLPLLAPMVMAWLASRIGGGQGQATTANANDNDGGGLLGSILGQVLGGGNATAQSSGAGGILGGILGGLLGGGRK